ncbi:MAG: polysaccharide biosynthesis protein, partial [Thermoleophilia bacterium]|nr:polysaccharide biosynthesis protein [Thermoleophilia bacterium]
MRKSSKLPTPDHEPLLNAPVKRQRPTLLRRAARLALRAFRSRVLVLLRGHRIWHVVVDAVLIAAAWWLAFYIRFDSGTPAYYQRSMESAIGVVVLLKLGVFVLTGVYAKFWRYLTVKDMEGVVRSVVVASGASLLYLFLVPPLGYVTIPRSVAVLDFGFTLVLVCGVRVLTRSVFERPQIGRRGRGRKGVAPVTGTPVIVAGAGEAGRLLLREMQRSSEMGLSAVGLVDDDSAKLHMRLDGVEVLGTTAQIPELIANSGAEEVLIAMPSATGPQIQRIVDLCRAADVKVRILPSLNELVLGDLQNLAGRLREVQVEDVLGRDQITVDLQQIAAYLTGQVVIITGAGGSIGSELCRQIAGLGPEQVIIVDQSEGNLFAIEQELLTERGISKVVPVLADINDVNRMRRVFDEYKPKVVFHAAAYKHVPMMEANPVEAVRNNAFGTRAMCEIAERSGVDRFVLVSTDKAVEPTTVMGQSKALAEWIVQGFAERSFHTRFMAVRFGNVLGSSGSVVPIFRRQIERGGPVRVTDERMTRFFMTIPEAVQLIIQAGAMGAGGEVFVLDMGTPVKIIDLARNMIELSGLKPGVDIQIEVVGIRPGEKLHEELWSGDEQPEPTRHPKIYRSRSSHVLDADGLLDELADLQ